MKTGKEGEILQDFPKRSELRKMLMAYYSAKDEESFNRTEDASVLKKVLKYFKDREKDYVSSSSKQRAEADALFSKVPAGGVARRARLP